MNLPSMSALARPALRAMPSSPATIAAGVAWVVVVFAGSGLVLVFLDEPWAAVEQVPFVVGFLTPFTVVGWLLASRRPGNPLGWLFLAVGLVEGVAFAAGQVAAHALVVAPGSLPGGREAAWLADMAWWVGPVILLPLLFLRFPTGRVLARWWRTVEALLLGGLVIAWAPLAVATWPGRGSSFTGSGEIAAPDVVVPVASIGAVAIGLAFLGALASVVVRTVHASGTQRRQLTWFACGAATAAVGVVGLFLGLSGWAQLAAALLMATLPASVGVAVLRENLLDISLVLHRTVTFAVLTSLLAMVFVATSVTAGLLLRGWAPDVLAIVATAVVAALGQPLYARLRRGIDRMIYGIRHDADEVLERLAHRLDTARSPDELLDEACGAVAAALPFARVEIRTEAGQVVRGDPDIAVDLAVPLEHHGENVGELRVGGIRPGDQIQPGDRRLLDRVSRHIAGVARSAELSAALRRSRDAAVVAREEERRRLRRDLHDGLGSSLAALGAGLEAALDEQPDQQRLALLAQLLEASHACLDDVRRLAHGLRPPTLDELGLAEAIRTLTIGLCRHGPKLEFDIDLASDPPADLEVAAYRIVAEAVTNVVRHAHAARCTVTLRRIPGDDGDANLLIDVTDDGRGIAAPVPGVGLQSIRERVDELGGVVRIDCLPSGGTAVEASLPWSVNDG